MHPITDADHVAGPADATVTLVEYGDFQCPDCGRAEPVLREVRERMGERLRFAFRNFPLIDIHEHALGAAEAAEAADAQGEYWPMHDLLLQNQRNLTRRDLEDYAERIGLDLTAFRKALDGYDARGKVMREVDEASAAGIHATPTLFLNGVLYEGPLAADAIISAAGA